VLLFLALVLIADPVPIHSTVADSTRVALIAQTPVYWEDAEYDSLSYIRFYDGYFLETTGSYRREMGQFNLLGDPALDISDRIKYPNDCDLVIHESDITVSGYPLETRTGTDLAMTFTVRNIGAQDSDEFDARIVFSHDQSFSPVVVNCDALEAGVEAEYQYTWDCAQ